MNINLSFGGRVKEKKRSKDLLLCFPSLRTNVVIKNCFIFLKICTNQMEMAFLRVCVRDSFYLSERLSYT